MWMRRCEIGQWQGLRAEEVAISLQKRQVHWLREGGKVQRIPPIAAQA
jgi:hypothetical protein